MKIFTVSQTIIFVFNWICLNGANMGQPTLTDEHEIPQVLDNGENNYELPGLVQIKMEPDESMDESSNKPNTIDADEHEIPQVLDNSENNYELPVDVQIKMEPDKSMDESCNKPNTFDADEHEIPQASKSHNNLPDEFNIKPKPIENYFIEEQDTSYYVENMSFKYWNHSLIDPENYKIFEFNKEYELKDYWLNDCSLKVIIHGWLRSDEDETGIFCIKRAYLNSEIKKYNIITVNWGNIAKNRMYFKVARSCIMVGIILGYFLSHLELYGMVKPSDIHVMGHSMGAHIAGISGNTFYNITGKKIERITGMDPSNPGFDGSWWPYWNTRQRLKSEDANFVDVIHTAIGMFGISMIVGHTDFYPNDGRSPQPKCVFEMPWNIARCSHSTAYEYYCESVNNPKSFESLACSSMQDYEAGDCDRNVKNYMGHYADSKYQGTFFLKTNRKRPYGDYLSRSESTSSRSSSVRSPSGSESSSRSSSESESSPRSSYLRLPSPPTSPRRSRSQSPRLRSRL